MNTSVANDARDKVRTINVRVLTTSGKYPDKGHEKVPEAEALQQILDRAAAKLGIVDTTSWKLANEGKEGTISPTSTYEQLGLHGEVTLDWGPNAGGGGAR